MRRSAAAVSAFWAEELWPQLDVSVSTEDEPYFGPSNRIRCHLEGETRWLHPYSPRLV